MHTAKTWEKMRSLMCACYVVCSFCIYLKTDEYNKPNLRETRSILLLLVRILQIIDRNGELLGKHFN